MASRINIGPEDGPYVGINESSGNLQLEDNSGNVVAEWDETNAQWDFANNTLNNVDALNSNSVNTEQVNNTHYVSISDDIQTVLDNVDSGDEIIFLPGTHECDEAVLDNISDVTLDAYDGAMLQMPPKDLDEAGATWILEIGEGCTNVDVKNILFDANRDEHTGSETTAHEALEYDGSNALIENCTFINSPSEGLDMDSGSNVTVRDCDAENCGGWGIHVSEDTSSHEVTGCVVVDCGETRNRGGIDQWNTAEKARIHNNTIINCNYGTDLRGSDGMVKNNSYIDCRVGIRLRDRDQTPGTAQSNTVESNKIINATEQGIQVEDGSAILRNNDIQTTGGDGIQILDGAEDVTIIGGEIENAAEHGIDARDGSGPCEIRGVKIINSGFSAINYQGDDLEKITDCTIKLDSDTGYAIRVFPSAIQDYYAQISGNTIKAEVDTGVRLRDVKFVTCTDNAIEVLNVAIEEVADADNNIIRDNVVNSTITIAGTDTMGEGENQIGS